MATSPSKPRIAILDDYQRVALTSTDWSTISSRADVTVFNDTILTDSDNGDALVARLAPFEVICSMRERTKFPKDILARLPNLKLLTTTAMRNMGIDVEAAQEEGILVAGTRYRAFSTVEHKYGPYICIACSSPLTLRHQLDAHSGGGSWHRPVA